MKVAQSCPTLCNSLCTVHGLLQARILEWVASPFSRGSSQPGIEPWSPILQAYSLPAEPQGKPREEVSSNRKHGQEMPTGKVPKADHIPPPAHPLLSHIWFYNVLITDPYLYYS